MLDASHIPNDTRIIDLTVGELRSLLAQAIPAPVIQEKKERRLVYGLKGLAELFHCSTQSAYNLKRSGKINKAITQEGRKIIIDADLALELAGKVK